MQTELLASIIVPIYNVERYLDECIQSLVSQTYRNIEILLIDDGSKDASGKMADTWSEKDDRIKVYHQVNSGVSRTRNFGLEKIRGEYVFFVDSDDYIAENYVEELVRLMEKENTEMAMCNVFIVWKDTIKLTECLPEKNKVMSYSEFFEGFYTFSGHYSMMCNKAYRRSLFDGVVFAEGKVNEDARIMLGFMPKINKVAYVSKGLYFYRQTKGSIMRGGDRERLLQSELEWIGEHLNYQRQKEDEKLYMLARKLYFNKVIEYYLYIKKETQKIMRSELKKVGKELMFYKNMLGKVKYKILFCMYFPRIYALYKCGRSAQKHVFYE